MSEHKNMNVFFNFRFIASFNLLFSYKKYLFSDIIVLSFVVGTNF